VLCCQIDVPRCPKDSQFKSPTNKIQRLILILDNIIITINNTLNIIINTVNIRHLQFVQGTHVTRTRGQEARHLVNDHVEQEKYIVFVLSDPSGGAAYTYHECHI